MQLSCSGRLHQLCFDESGQDLVEYSLLLAFLALATMALLSSAGSSVKSLWTKLNSSLTSAAS